MTRTVRSSARQQWRRYIAFSTLSEGALLYREHGEPEHTEGGDRSGPADCVRSPGSCTIGGSRNRAASAITSACASPLHTTQGVYKLKIYYNRNQPTSKRIICALHYALHLLQQAKLILAAAHQRVNVVKRRVQRNQREGSANHPENHSVRTHQIQNWHRAQRNQSVLLRESQLAAKQHQF